MKPKLNAEARRLLMEQQLRLFIPQDLYGSYGSKFEMSSVFKFMRMIMASKSFWASSRQTYRIIFNEIKSQSVQVHFCWKKREEFGGQGVKLSYNSAGYLIKWLKPLKIGVYFVDGTEVKGVHQLCEILQNTDNNSSKIGVAVLTANHYDFVTILDEDNVRQFLEKFADRIDYLNCHSELLERKILPLKGLEKLSILRVPSFESLAMILKYNAKSFELAISNDSEFFTNLSVKDIRNWFLRQIEKNSAKIEVKALKMSIDFLCYKKVKCFIDEFMKLCPNLNEFNIDARFKATHGNSVKDIQNAAKIYSQYMVDLKSHFVGNESSKKIGISLSESYRFNVNGNFDEDETRERQQNTVKSNYEKIKMDGWKSEVENSSWFTTTLKLKYTNDDQSKFNIEFWSVFPPSF